MLFLWLRNIDFLYTGEGIAISEAAKIQLCGLWEEQLSYPFQLEHYVSQFWPEPAH